MLVVVPGFSSESDDVGLADGSAESPRSGPRDQEAKPARRNASPVFPGWKEDFTDNSADVKSPSS